MSTAHRERATVEPRIGHGAKSLWAKSILRGFVAATADRLSAYVASRESQQSELGQGKQSREERNEMVKSLIARRKKIQYAADTAWPPRQPGSGKARVEFQLPADRPFSY